MNIYFKNITADNWREAIALKISKEQERYLPHSNLISIAESKFYPEWTTLGIYKDEDIIGFSIYGLEDERDKEIWLIRYMIDERYQGQGYGKYTLEKLIEKIKEETKCDRICLSFHPESRVAEKLYSGLGFKQFITGFEAEDEIFYKLEIE
ncbi:MULTISPECIES: GNAT family N-acetyltransferase [unclassified Clostridium]|uniref:GNAT family N-acetyltransferase n=1 Tax=unclassified Clostridium TaxID=2614128 RepID=UPI0025C2D81F|nr:MULTISPECIES: GNAT family N-acetyltransferase [unclassified Clostridium]